MLDRIDIKFFKLAVGVDALGKETAIDIQARCPICGDSRRRKNLKRLHLYKKKEVTNVNCFNGDCSVHNRSVYSFLRDFYPTLLPQYKREMFGQTMSQLANNEPVDKFKKFEKKETIDILTQDLSQYFTPIEDKPEALEYLIKKRGFEYNKDKFGEWFFGHQNLKIGDTLYTLENSIIIPLYYQGKMYGFYSRNISNKIFCTYMNDANIGYKVWNWFNIDKSRPCYIYEGIFDCISGNINNSVALMGAKLPDERLEELKTPIFVLDNDITGLNNSLEYAKKGHKVYIQPQQYEEKDINELYMNHPDLNVSYMIQNNIHSGINAEVLISNIFNT